MLCHAPADRRVKRGTLRSVRTACPDVEVGQDPSEPLVRCWALQDRVRQGGQATRRVTRTERWRVAG